MPKVLQAHVTHKTSDRNYLNTDGRLAANTGSYATRFPGFCKVSSRNPLIRKSQAFSKKPPDSQIPAGSNYNQLSTHPYFASPVISNIKPNYY